MTRSRTYLAAGGLLFLGSLAVHGQDIELRPVRIPNDLSYWRQSGFVEMVPPVRLPTDKSNNDVITVGATTLLFTTRDFPDRQSALAYRKKPGEREETTYVK